MQNIGILTAYDKAYAFHYAVRYDTLILALPLPWSQKVPDGIIPTPIPMHLLP